MSNNTINTKNDYKQKYMSMKLGLKWNTNFKIEKKK